jgi:hypothetical protein
VKSSNVSKKTSRKRQRTIYDLFQKHGAKKPNLDTNTPKVNDHNQTEEEDEGEMLEENVDYVVETFDADGDDDDDEYDESVEGLDIEVLENYREPKNPNGSF